MSESNPWPLTARVSPGYLLKAVLVGIMCLVFGVWGIYDYTFALPQQSLHWHRAEVARAMNRIAEPALNGSSTPVDQDTLDFFTNTVRADLQVEPQPKLQAVLKKHSASVLTLEGLRRVLGSAVADTQESTEKAVIDAIKAGALDTNVWLGTVNKMVQFAQAPVTLDGSPQKGLAGVRNISNEMLLVAGDIHPPSKFDHQMQWLFILCLPFVPWYGWAAIKSSRRKYQLDEDGTLHHPEGRWPKDDIAEIDMHRWMAKSKAWVEHVDGTRVLLDDYVYKGLWKIVGSLAAAHHGDAWTDDAKPIKVESDDVDTSDSDVKPDSASDDNSDEA